MTKIIVLASLIVLLSCTMKRDSNVTAIQTLRGKPRSEAIEKNNLAIRIYTQYRGNNDSLQLAIAYLDEAIAIDSTYLLAYVNKAQIQCQIGNAMNAVNTMNIACMKKPNDRTYLTGKGFYQDIAGEKDEAQNSYKQALAIYNRLIQEYPDSATLYLEKYFILHFIVKDPIILKDSINYYKKKFSDNLFWKEFDFSRLSKDKYLKGMTNDK